MSSQLGFSKVASFMIGLKEIWDHRNLIIHEDSKLDPNSVINSILTNLARVSHSYNPKSPPSSRDFSFAIDFLNISPKSVPFKRGKWIKWHPPSTGLKLNTDGSSKHGIATGGGVIRGTDGQFTLAFCINFGTGTNMEAELKALLFGINLCSSNSITLSQIETDSMTLREFITSSTGIPWHVDLSYEST